MNHSRETMSVRDFAVPQGNTCRGVNRAIIDYLRSTRSISNHATILDCPCGYGDLTKSLLAYWPQARVYGADVERLGDLQGSRNFEQVDASKPFRVFQETQFDLITCVSGVPEFDNTLQFFQSCREHLDSQGLFLVSNDNFISLRERISQLFFGKYRQYHLFAPVGLPTWKVIPIHNLVRLLMDAGFQIEHVEYVSFRTKDALLFPLALAVYAVQLLGFRFHKRMQMPDKWKRHFYPFRSLFYRHYFVVCRKASTPVNEFE